MNTEATITCVMHRISRHRLVRARIGAAVHGFFSIIALIALIPTYQYLSDAAASSGFSAYLSLLASDGTVLAHSWQAFGLTLVESAPIAGFVLMIAILLVLSYSARKTFGDWRRMRTVARA